MMLKLDTDPNFVNNVVSDEATYLLNGIMNSIKVGTGLNGCWKPTFSILKRWMCGQEL